MTSTILVSEVGPRDGLQSIKTIVPLSAKKAWITALAASGLREIEVGSFVSPKWVPQLADTADVVAHALTIPNLTVAVLVPNAQGAEAAIAAGAHKITVPFSASETHSLRNVKRTHAQMLDEVRNIRALLRGQPAAQQPRFEGSLSTAFGCTYEGIVPADRVVRLAEQLREAGCDDVGLADSVGYANPAQVKDLVTRVRASVGDRAFAGLHLHNTRGLGLANVVAGLEAGVTTFDSSMAGIGGCPFAPGATGNIVTEDLVFMLEAMGLATGIDLQKLFAARKILAEAVPNEELYGYVPAAGLPLGYHAQALAKAM
jgi:hydroxymethylglutaryl-CoA lyase